MLLVVVIGGRVVFCVIVIYVFLGEIFCFCGCLVIGVGFDGVLCGVGFG